MNLMLRPDAPVDLQLHTTYSDGKWMPADLIDHLVREGFGLAAITDHDRTDTAALLQQMALEKHFPLIVATEISGLWRDEPVDLLCYGFDLNANPLHDLAQDIVQRQTLNTQTVWNALLQQGQRLPDEAELTQLLQTPSAQQPHAFVALLKQHGYDSPGKMLVEAGLAFATADVKAVVTAAHQSHAVCLIAHPGRGEGYVQFDAALLDQLRVEAPVDGLEAYYPDHSPEQTTLYLDYAQKHDLLTSSGSDSHKPEAPPIPYRADLSARLLERLGIRFTE